MPGGNFNPLQIIKHGRVEWPWGQLTLDAGFSPTWLQSWIVQGGTTAPNENTFFPGPAQSTNESAYWSGFAQDYWVASEPGWLSGSFTHGPAVGIAVLAVSDGTNVKYEFWVDAITLLD
jgi:hypothetical protein